MLRKRMISPEIWEDEHFGSLSMKARILFIACISNADDEGRFNANPHNLRAIAFRYDDLSINEIKKLIEEVSSTMNNLQIYSVNGCNYGSFTKWNEHQTLRADRLKPSRIPPVNQASTSCQPNVGVREGKLREDKLREDKLREDNMSAEGVPYIKIINDLNQVLNSKYMSGTPKTRELIKARWNEGFRLEDFQVVHRNMAAAWGPDAKMRQYLRPLTLYGVKFESYLNRPPEMRVSTAGAKTYQAGQRWLAREKSKEEAKNAGQAEISEIN